MKVLILANGHIEDYKRCMAKVPGYDMLLCCDGGLRHAKALNLTPQMILGDFDSVNPAMLESYGAQGIQIVPYPTHKDYTDMELAVEHALGHNPTAIYILGGIGSRLDHTLANIHVLHHALKAGVPAFLINENHCICLTDSTVTIDGKKGDLLSLIPLTSQVTGISTQGLAYPLRQETLAMGQSRGVSNVFTGDKANIQIDDGVLIVMTSDESM